MNRAQMLISLGGLLAACVLVGLIFIIFGITGYATLPTRFVVAAAGILLIVGGAVGVLKLKKLKYG